MPHTGILAEMTIDDVRELAPNTGVVAIGSTEGHGSALPYGTDTYVIEHTAYSAVRLANQRGARCLALPPLPISLNNNMRALPFACRISVPTFMALLEDLVTFLEAEGVRRVVLLNGHGGNPDAIRAVLRHLARRDGAFCCLVNGWEASSPESLAAIVHPSDHGGEAEAAQMLHLRPHLVRPELFRDQPVVPPDIALPDRPPVQFVRPWHRFLPESGGGDSRHATAEKGRALLDSAVESLAELLVTLSTAPDLPEFPWA